MERVLDKSRSYTKENEIVGCLFGRLTVLGYEGMDSKSNRYCRFRCSCGTEKILRLEKVKSGRTRSCGCLRYESRPVSIEARKKISHSKRKHGFGGNGLSRRRSKFYTTYHGIRQRCTYRKAHNYKRYGGRGIECLWKDFNAFKSDMYDLYLDHVSLHGEKNTYIERIDNNGNYCKENCRWATAREQARNKSSNKWIKFQGQTAIEADWIEVLGICQSTINGRMRRGFSVQDAFTKPIRKTEITYNGETKRISQWAKEIGIDSATLSKRLRRWTLDKAMSTPNLAKIDSTAKR